MGSLTPPRSLSFPVSKHWVRCVGWAADLSSGPQVSAFVLLKWIISARMWKWPEDGEPSLVTGFYRLVPRMEHCRQCSTHKKMSHAKQYVHQIITLYFLIIIWISAIFLRDNTIRKLSNETSQKVPENKFITFDILIVAEKTNNKQGKGTQIIFYIYIYRSIKHMLKYKSRLTHIKQKK